MINPCHFQNPSAAQVPTVDAVELQCLWTTSLEEEYCKPDWMKNKEPHPILSLIPTTFNTPELSDIKVICENETFLCHKLVLSLGSPVFKAMFLSHTKEKEEGQVTIKGVGKDPLKLMLEWMYGANIKAEKLRTQQQRLELYKVAHFFLVDPLKDFLIQDILTALTPETAFDVYDLGDTYGEPKLKKKAAQVMKRKKVTVLSKDKVVLRNV